MTAQPAAFGRLCVETFSNKHFLTLPLPAAFGRLCVETLSIGYAILAFEPSRLRAAVC